jgi:hypothetical protein
MSYVAEESVELVRDEIERFVISAIARACHCDPAVLSGDTYLIEIGFDSLSLTGVYAQCEVTYGCRFEEEAVMQMLEVTQVGELVAIVIQCVSRNS